MIYNLLILLSSFVPVWAILLDQIPLKGRKWFILAEVSLISLAIVLFGWFQNPRWYGHANLIWSLYFMEIAAFLFLASKKFGHQNFSRNLAISLLFVYVLSEAHEWSGFVFSDYLGLYIDPWSQVFGKVPLWQRFLSNLYVILSFIIACRWSGIKRSWRNVFLFGATMLIPVFFLVIPLPNIIHLLKRFSLFLCWAAIFYLNER